MNKKKKLILLGGILILLIIIIVCIILIINKKEDKNYIAKDIISSITLDINPSIKLELNKDKLVINIIALNNAAADVIAFDYMGKDIDTVISRIITNLVDKSYITEDVIILVGTKGEIEGNDVKLLLENKLSNKGISYEVIIPTITENSSKIANEYGITESKASYLEDIVNRNTDLKIEDIKDMSIKEINNKIEEIKNKKEQEQNKTNKNTTNNDNNISKYNSIEKCNYVNTVLTNEEAGIRVANMMGATVGTGNYCDKLAPESYITLSSNGTCVYKVTFKYRTKRCIYYIGVETGNIIEGPTCTSELVEEGEAQCIIMESLGETRRENVHLKKLRDNGSEWIYDLEDVYGTPDENGNRYIYEYHISKYTGAITSKINIGILY